MTKDEVKQEIRQFLTKAMTDGYGELDRALKEETSDAFLGALSRLISQLLTLYVSLGGSMAIGVIEKREDQSCPIHEQMRRAEKKPDTKLN